MTGKILPPNQRGYLDPSILVTTEWLAAHINDDNVVVVDTDDPAEYARLYVGYIRGFGESSLRLHLFGPAAKISEEVDTLIEEFFRRLTRYYQAEPGRHASETMIMTLVLRRR